MLGSNGECEVPLCLGVDTVEGYTKNVVAVGGNAVCIVGGCNGVLVAVYGDGLTLGCRLVTEGLDTGDGGNNKLTVDKLVLVDDFLRLCGVFVDDGACGCPIPMLDSYVSILREKSLSITLLLQSESQLVSLYNESRATTIINNCDTYVFLGSMDLGTGKNISLKANIPLDEVLYMPVGSEILFRRGQKPIFTTRYNIRNNPLY